MRKIKFLSITTIVLSIFLLSTIFVNAEILPIKDAWIFNDNCVVILRENGDLLFGDSIETQTPKLLAQDIVDFKGYCSPLGHFDGYALHNNGDVTKIYSNKSIYENKQVEIKTETVNSNVKEIFYEDGVFASIDKNQKITSRQCDLTIDNSKKFYLDSLTSRSYIISTNDTLHRISLGAEEAVLNKDNEVMTDVQECMIANGGDIMVLRNNGDLYLCKENDTPSRIGVNIDNLGKVAYYDTWTDNYPIDYVNKNGEYFSGTSEKAPIKYLDNVRDVYIISDNRYVITNDNILYSFGPYHWGINTNSKSTTLKAGIQGIYLDKSILGDKLGFTVNSKGMLFSYLDSKFIAQDVKKVVAYYDNGSSENFYLFIKENGEMLGATNKPQNNFITSFCQKQTVVKINKKEIELTAKIQVIDNRSMYPFRECLENMGATVLWDATNQIAIGEYDGITIEFPIGKNEYYINGVRHEMDTKAYVDESIGRTYIPIRYAAEGLGFTVDWIEGKLENVIDIYK